jgi:hypothetical protein
MELIAVTGEAYGVNSVAAKHFGRVEECCGSEFIQ